MTIKEEDIRPQDDFPAEVFLAAVDEKYAGSEYHWHDCFELLYSLKGRSYQSVNHRSFELKEGDLLIIKPGDLHKTTCCENEISNVMVIKFLPKVIDAFYAGKTDMLYLTAFLNLETSPLIHLTGREREEIEPLFIKINQEYMKKQSGYEMAIKGYLLVLIACLTRLNQFDFWQIQHRLLDNEPDMVRLIDYITENSSQDIKLRDVAKLLNFNYSYCSRYFKNQIGKNFTDYLKFVRICKAEQMIVTQNMTITQAAVQCGFADVSSFSKAYTAFRGYSPKILKSKK